MKAGAYGHLLIEFEIVVELGADLPAPGGHCSRDEAQAAVRPAFELADDRHPDIAAAAVIVPQAHAHGRLTEQAVIDCSRDNMSACKVPRCVEFRDVLPATGAGMVLRRLLKS